MAKLVGIDIRAGHVRAALVHTTYRRFTVERMIEVEIANIGSVEQALQAAALPLMADAEAIAVALEGDTSFIHRITLPATAAKQITQVLPFELEAHVPVDIDELVYDHRLLQRSAADPVVVLTAAARTEHVRERIRLVRAALGREPDRIGCGPLPLANLASLTPQLSGPGPIALIDLGGTRTEVVLLANGEPVFARTLSRGVQGLPQSAPLLVAELRQTFAGWDAHGGAPIAAAYLLGGGAAVQGALEYLSGTLGLRVDYLPNPGVDGVGPDDFENVRRFAKAISLALGLSARPRDLDLRRGPLAFQRGYGFLKERMPLLSGLLATILISFGFSTWANLRSLSRENEVLTAALGTLSKDVLGTETTSASEANELLQKIQNQEEADPMPHMDAFDVIVELSKAIPSSIVHDIEEFDMQRGHVKINALVSSTADAQLISGAMQAHRCLSDVKISKITQAINIQRQKYVLEFDVKCPEDDRKKKKKTEPAPASSEEKP
jgi:general secretion pathway protein L